MYIFWSLIMITVTATEFKAKCLAMIEEMNRTKVPIIVTNHGKRVAQMYPARHEAEVGKAFIGSLKGTVTHYNDPFGPALDPNEWGVVK
jgi:prevent-host-death family protein